MTVTTKTVSSGYSTGTINENFQTLEDYINDNLLNRDGTTTGEVNQLELDIDINSHRLFNLPLPVNSHEAARLADIQNAIEGDTQANLISFTPIAPYTSDTVQGAIEEVQFVDTSTGTDQTLEEALDDRDFWVSSLAALKATNISELSADQKSTISTTGRSGDFIWVAGDQSTNVTNDPQEGVWVAPDSDTTGSSGAYQRVLPVSNQFDAKHFGASSSGTNADNKTAVDAAIAFADFVGGGRVIIPHDIDYGFIQQDLSTQPDLSGATSDIVVEDYSESDVTSSGDKSGAQVRYHFHTAETDPPAQHNGNGVLNRAAHAPYFWVENTANLASGGDPSRTTIDNRRASIFYANDGLATWRLGQGTLESDTLDDDDLSNFVLESFNGPVTAVPFLVHRKTGNMSFGNGTNNPQANFHFRTLSGGFRQFLVESDDGLCVWTLRTSAGSGDDVEVRNNAGDLELNIPGVGSGITVDGGNRTVKVSNLLGLPHKTVAELSTASSFEGYMAYVTDADGGASPAYSNGTSWISLLTGTAV